MKTKELFFTKIRKWRIKYNTLCCNYRQYAIEIENNTSK